MASFSLPAKNRSCRFYPSHGLFFAALLGQNVAEAVEYFRQRAEEAGAPADVSPAGTLPAEVYLALLARLARYDEALAAAARFVPPGTRTTGFAPNLMELSRRAGRFDRLIDLCEQRGDVVGFAAGLVERQLKTEPVENTPKAAGR